MILLHKRKSGLSLGCVCHEHGAANRGYHFYENKYAIYKLRFIFN